MHPSRPAQPAYTAGESRSISAAAGSTVVIPRATKPISSTTLDIHSDDPGGSAGAG